ncbi:putative slx1 protein [Gigaspora margarita]|uniref:Putative slx1 protein n=1 Tax=Gigaspora margarita TaxID=4874 RepID=A0A8H4AA72_GIGMA|nr:putative slx1 protein [Gigaspora margarita]
MRKIDMISKKCENENAQKIYTMTLNCVYLIRFLNPNHQNYCYIGTTPDPQKCLRQHNGAGLKEQKQNDLGNSFLIVYRFSNKKAALQVSFMGMATLSEKLQHNKDEALRASENTKS